MKSAEVTTPSRGLNLALDVAVSFPERHGTSILQGSYPLHYLPRHEGANASIMDDPIPTLNPAELGSYESYLAARCGGIRAARGMSRAGTIDRSAKTDEDKDCGEESVVINKTGHFVNFSTGSLRVLQTDL